MEGMGGWKNLKVGQRVGGKKVRLVPFGRKIYVFADESV